MPTMPTINDSLVLAMEFDNLFYVFILIKNNTKTLCYWKDRFAFGLVYFYLKDTLIYLQFFTELKILFDRKPCSVIKMSINPTSCHLMFISCLPTSSIFICVYSIYTTDTKEVSKLGYFGITLVVAYGLHYRCLGTGIRRICRHRSFRFVRVFFENYLRVSTILFVSSTGFGIVFIQLTVCH